MKFIMNNRFIQIDSDLITKIIYDENESAIKISYKLFEVIIIKASKEDYKKFLSYIEISLMATDVNALTEDENELKKLEIKKLNEKIKKLQFELENNLTLTGSLDIRTLINLDERLKIIENQFLNKELK
jgi:hypothetical protein